MRASGRLHGLVALTALLVAVPAWANFESDYVAGLAALDHGDYVQAQTYLKKAIAAQPDPVRSVTIGGNRQPYLPHHFLGMVAYRQGDCAMARSEWQSAMNRRMLGRLYTLKRDEDDLIDKCQDKKSAKATTQAAATTAPSAADTQSSKDFVAPNTLIAAFDAYVAGRYTQAARIDPQTMTDKRAQYQAYVLRAASRFALSRLGSGTSMLNSARSDARAAQNLDQSTPDARIFSSAFRAFYALAK